MLAEERDKPREAAIILLMSSSPGYDFDGGPPRCSPGGGFGKDDLHKIPGTKYNITPRDPGGATSERLIRSPYQTSPGQIWTEVLLP